MIKKNLIKILILLFFISGCGYNPIFSNKNSTFSIIEIKFTGNNRSNKILKNKLDNYKSTNGKKLFSLKINTNLKKEIASKDTKGNPKTYKMDIKLLQITAYKAFSGIPHFVIYESISIITCHTSPR